MNIKKIASHLKGKETKETKQLFAEVEKKLVESGFKSPFKFRKIALGPINMPIAWLELGMKDADPEQKLQLLQNFIESKGLVKDFIQSSTTDQGNFYANSNKMKRESQRTEFDELADMVVKFIHTGEFKDLQPLAELKARGKEDYITEVVGEGVSDFLASLLTDDARDYSHNSLFNMVYEALDSVPIDDLQLFDEMDRADEAREMKNSREPF